MSDKNTAKWTFLTNHAHVLLCLAKSKQMTMRDISQQVGITERAVQRIIHDLDSEKYIEIKKEGRRNLYTPNEHKHLKHPIEAHRNVADLLRLVAELEEES